MNLHKTKKCRWCIAVHCGSDKKGDENISEFNKKLQSIVNECSVDLENGKSSVDIVSKAICIMEDDPRFNAGTGSVTLRNYKHNVQMDACIVDGKTGKSGTVIGIYNVRNPISVAKSLLLDYNYPSRVMFGTGAYSYARIKNIRCTSFDTSNKIKTRKMYDTVGCICLDVDGNFCAGSSTGGTSVGRVVGRVGDIGIVGAGTFAENNVCAVVCSGIGEYFIKKMFAHDFVCRMKYGKMSLKEAMFSYQSENIPGSCLVMDSNGMCLIGNFSGYKMLAIYNSKYS